MKLIWTKSNLPLSKFICWGLDEPVSHFAIVFDNRVVFHSNLYGTHIEWFNTFKKKCEVVFEIDIPMSLEEEEQVYQSVIDTYDDKSYDWGAFAFFIWSAFKKKFLGKPMPTKNEWGSDSAYLCVGLAEALKGRFPEIAQLGDADMVSPYQLYLFLDKLFKGN